MRHIKLFENYLFEDVVGQILCVKSNTKFFTNVIADFCSFNPPEIKQATLVKHNLFHRF